MPRRQSRNQLNYLLSEAESQRRIKNLIALGYIEKVSDIPEGAIPASTTIPAGEYYCLPVPFYAQEEYHCRDCGEKAVWTALDKYQYYEVEKGNQYAKRVRCDSCHRKATE